MANLILILAPKATNCPKFQAEQKRFFVDYYQKKNQASFFITWSFIRNFVGQETLI